MKPFALLSILILSPLMTYSQECGQCSRPRVLLYDSEIRVVRPTDPQSIIAWYNLFSPGSSARGYLHTKDPNKDCIRWIDGALVNANELQGDTLKFGTEFLNLPPAGSLGSGEYLITGVVEELGVNNYRYSLILETAESRKIVKTVAVEFEATPMSAFGAGESAAKGLTSLYSTIREYERNARDGDTDVAISDLDMKGLEIITLKPEKTLINTGQTINVDVTMTDCDGVPLGNRQIIFKDTTVAMNDTGYTLNGTKGGQITPWVAYTDDLGKVTVQFKSGTVGGTAEINAWYPHYKPCGRPGAFHGAAFVQIDNPPVRTWLLEATISREVVKTRDTTKEYIADDKQHIVYNNQRITTGSRARIMAVIENRADDPDRSFNFYEEEPIALLVSGSGYFDDNYMHTEKIDGEMLWVTSMNTNISGYPRPDAAIIIEITDDYKYFTIGTGITGNGSYHNKSFSGGSWTNESGKYQNFEIECSGGGSDEDSCLITKADSIYSIFWMEDKTELDYSSDGTGVERRIGSLGARLMPYHPGSTSGVEQELLFPQSSSLSQNYPNPFSSSTTITFQLERRQHVDLTITDMLGNTMAVLADQTLPRGTYSFPWNAGSMPQGIYFCRLRTGSYLITKKMVLLK